MSESDPDELPEPGWFDLESELPGILSVDPTIELGVNVSFPSANRIQEVRALIIGNSSATGTAPNTGILLIQVGNGPQEEESSKGEIFLDTPTHTPPQSKSPSPIPLQRGWSIWVEGEGWNERGEGEF